MKRHGNGAQASGQEHPLLQSPRIGPVTLSAFSAKRAWSAPMGPLVPADAPPFGLIMKRGFLANVWDADGNRYVDLAAGFGALLLGHCHPQVKQALSQQLDTLWQAMGDLYTSEVKLQLLQRLAQLAPFAEAQVILGQSGADAITSAIKTAMLFTGRSQLIGFQGAYHGLSFAPLRVCGLRDSYRAPFSAALGSSTQFLPYPEFGADTGRLLEQLAQLLTTRTVAAVVIEPILGRGGVRVCAPGFLSSLHALCREHGSLLVADEIWTGLGRAGAWLSATDEADLEARATPHAVPFDILCLGKGLGGGVPISACIAPKDIMSTWARSEEVVDTSTFAGAPLSCAAALATLSVLEQESLVTASATKGRLLQDALRSELAGTDVQVRGKGLMLALDLGARPGAAVQVMGRLLDHGVIVSSGGGHREVVVLTPPLNIEQSLLDSCVPLIGRAVRALA